MEKKNYHLGKHTTVPYIRSFYAYGVRYVSWDLMISSDQGIIDTNVEKVLKFVDQLMQFKITTYLSNGNTFFAEDFNVSDHNAFRMSDKSTGRFQDENGQFFELWFKKRRSTNYQGWWIPLSVDEINQVMKRMENKELLQQILDPNIYPVWLRELFKTWENPNHGYEMTRFIFDQTFLKLGINNA